MDTRTVRIQRRLFRWYRRSGRNLPWRHTRDPYKILVSEVMLQQTQVERVIPKYRTWFREFPTLPSLARAPLRSVLKIWSGLGYNRRALNLQRAAKIVLDKHAGKIPTSVAELEALPGVGEYTARAVAAFAYKQPVSFLDTNVRRVVGRVVFGVTTTSQPGQLGKAASQLVPMKQADVWHHAVMDLGATVCVSGRPKCEICPLKRDCRAYPAILRSPIERPPKPQPRFQGSDRFWRGRIVAALVRSRLTPAQLHRQLQLYGRLTPKRMRTMLEALANQGLIASSGRYVKIPS